MKVQFPLYDYEKHPKSGTPDIYRRTTKRSGILAASLVIALTGIIISSFWWAPQLAQRFLRTNEQAESSPQSFETKTITIKNIFEQDCTFALYYKSNTIVEWKSDNCKPVLSITVQRDSSSSLLGNSIRPIHNPAFLIQAITENNVASTINLLRYQHVLTSESPLEKPIFNENQAQQTSIQPNFVSYIDCSIQPQCILWRKDRKNNMIEYLYSTNTSSAISFGKATDPERIYLLDRTSKEITVVISIQHDNPSLPYIQKVSPNDPALSAFL